MGEVIQFPVQQQTLTATLDRKLDVGGVTDQDLRDQLHRQSETWITWLSDQPKSINTAGRITLDIKLPPEALERVASECNRQVREILERELRDWFYGTGGKLLSALVSCAVGQAVLEQRARDCGVTLS